MYIISLLRPFYLYIMHTYAQRSNMRKLIEQRRIQFLPDQVDSNIEENGELPVNDSYQHDRVSSHYALTVKFS